MAVDHFLHTTPQDSIRAQDWEATLKQPTPQVNFNMRELSLNEIQEVEKAARASSLPGPSGVPLEKLQCTIWCRGVVAKQPSFAEGMWIPKEENSINLYQFRPISLLSIEGKIFCSFLSWWLTGFLLKNNYIDTPV